MTERYGLVRGFERAQSQQFSFFDFKFYFRTEDFSLCVATHLSSSIAGQIDVLLSERMNENLSNF